MWSSSPKNKCKHCGNLHSKKFYCKFSKNTCSICKKIGHLPKIYYFNQNKNVNFVEEQEVSKNNLEISREEEECLFLANEIYYFSNYNVYNSENQTRTDSSKGVDNPFKINLKIDNKTQEFIFDSEAAVSVCSLQTIFFF